VTLKQLSNFTENVLYVNIISDEKITLEFLLKNQRPPAEVAPAPSRGHPNTPTLLGVADFPFSLFNNAFLL